MCLCFKKQLFLLFSIFGCCSCVLDVSWWSSVAQLSTSSLLPHSIKPSCNELQGLSPGQADMCEIFKDHMPAVGHGAKQAIDECEYQFRDNRWNCSTPSGSGIIGPVHKLGTKEAAFTYAILSAGVSHEIGRRCKMGQLKSCGCLDVSKIPKDPSKVPKEVDSDDADGEWTWGGCGDNVYYGSRFAREFIDVREKEEKDEDKKKRSETYGRSLMNRWNNEAGRRILKNNLKRKCKCHGVSGSCNMKTCWMQMPSMRQVGDILQEKYKRANRFQINSRGNPQFVSQPEKRNLKKPKRSVELVFLDDSPDYCQENIYQGTVGTKGRVCSKDPRASNNCDLLCCGRGYNSYIEEVTYKCKCKFQWCCEVICQQCKNKTQVHVCK